MLAFLCHSILEDEAGDDQLFDEFIHVLPVAYVELDCTGFTIPVPTDEVIKSALSATHCDNFRVFLNKAVGHCGTDASRGTDDEDLLVLEWYFRTTFFVFEWVKGQGFRGKCKVGVLCPNSCEGNIWKTALYPTLAVQVDLRTQFMDESHQRRSGSGRLA